MANEFKVGKIQLFPQGACGLGEEIEPLIWMFSNTGKGKSIAV